MKKMKLVVATKNIHKLNEIKELLKSYRINIFSLLDFKNYPEIKETGKSFYENAYLKARSINKYTMLPTLADDSGLEVEALNNKPGIFSARYAGENASDFKRIKKLLKEMKDIPFEKRKARFVCCMVLIDGRRVFNVTGFCEGFIATKPYGKNGFGYDPVFYLPDLGKTMAQLEMEEKNIISHRANAIKKIKEILIEEYNLNKLK